jgi:processive 1,2-diacylglycerol beta-glucosyltransferase
MINLYDSDTGTALGRISDEQLTFLEDHLEEESGEDQDYYFSAATIDALEEKGADAELVALLRRAVGDREGVEVRWERAD